MVHRAPPRGVIVRAIRVGVVCDFREEGWHSMDLISDMLLDMLPIVAPTTIVATRLQPAMRRRLRRMPLVGSHARLRLGQGLPGRFYDYPRWLLSRVNDFDVFHIVPDTYAPLMRS